MNEITKKNTKLPEFIEPQTIKQAQSAIQNLGRNMAEHAYLIGSNLTWIKSQLKHGEFIPWIEKNLWFNERSGQRYIKFAENCVKEMLLLSYQPNPKTTQCRISNIPAEIQQGQFRTVIIDPPWPYGTQYNAETRRVASPYPEMSIEAITETKFPFADDCVLWFWTTHKFLPVSFEILEEWGFDYKATMVWNKEKLGIGYWLRMQCEFCLLAIKGNPVWDATDIRDTITEPRREHSRKPERFYKTILDNCPEPIGEAFSRQKRQGIEVITGNETSKFDE